MGTKSLITVAVVALLAFLAFYLASPFLTLRDLATAAKDSDRDVLALKVDFPSLRDSLKGQFNSFIAKNAANDPDLKGNPFAGLAMMIAPMMVDHLVDGYVTPDGVADLLKKPIEAAGASDGNFSLWRGRFSYLDLNHFRASYTNSKEPAQPFVAVLERRGLFDWKLTRLDLPLGEIAAATSKEGERAAPSPSQPPPPELAAGPQPPAPVAAADPSSLSALDSLPTNVGQCGNTMVVSIGTRLQDGSTGQPIAGSGSAINYRNGGYQVSYDQMPGIDSSQVGDPVRMCLVSIPEKCPPGDDRGKIYHVVNLRTNEEWDAPDAEHGCGGA